ncbi:hypothetical protein M0R88_10040 [Halorussus gelatinilyticus]|uniref:Uncharacterized protein n=1 Tax=Halorussus gelatinilyticus TaxID=2937524 RepID=A0A8U0ID45_9EURY|nr:hypothetical protein [Halorussus gelatinilyticus]UPV98872.1 hypothetical protein M0R88_10040 [Halorussus gelatinilyticus]
MNRDEAIERVEEILHTVENETMPVPVRELWVYGDVALGLDPVERLDVYVTKDILLRGDDGDAAERFRKSHGVEGVGKTVRAEWAEQFPEYIRANDSGHAAPEQCLAAHLLPEDEPVHLEVCNSSFEDNVTQRLQGAIQREAYEQILDPRGVCLWAEGQRSDEALRKLRESELPFPTLPDALGMLGLDAEKTDEAAEAVESYRKRQEGATVRGDVV